MEPVTTFSTFAVILPFTSTFLDNISVVSAPDVLLVPAIATVPSVTLNPVKAPASLSTGLPVVKMARSVLIKPKPLPVIPFWLAIIKFAF